MDIFWWIVKTLGQIFLPRLFAPKPKQTIAQYEADDFEKPVAKPDDVINGL